MYKTLESLIKANHVSTAGVVVSCKIPILAIRVRFPGSAQFFFHKVWHLSRQIYVPVRIYSSTYECLLEWVRMYTRACVRVCANVVGHLYYYHR